MCVFGIYANEQKDKDLAYTKKLISILQKNSIPLCVDENLSHFFGSCSEIGDAEPDIIAVIGGDGTMLSAVRKYAKLGVKFIGFNIGRVGFLLDSEISLMEDTVKAIINGDYTLEQRMLLLAEVKSGETGRVKYQQFALNDAVVSQKNILRMADLELSVNGVKTNNIHCDGIIVSTPTGSTGYSLSAGGPIVSPELDIMLITPVCPHTLASFNMVISEKDIIEIKPAGNTKIAVMTIDGQKSFDIGEKDTVTIRCADFKALFIKYTNKNFFSVLKDKLADWNDNRG